MKTRSIYIAGAWKERLGRILPLVNRLEKLTEQRVYFKPTVRWWEDDGTGPDWEMSSEERRGAALRDIEGVLDADVFWFVVPYGWRGRGAYVEHGAACALKVLSWRGEFEKEEPRALVVSGEDRKWSIFADLADFATDSDKEALAWIRELK